MGIGADRLRSLWCIEAVQDRRGMEERSEMRFDADWSGSHGGVRSGMVVNGEDKAGLLRRGRERSGCVRFYAVRYGRFAEARCGGDRWGKVGQIRYGDIGSDSVGRRLV